MFGFVLFAKLNEHLGYETEIFFMFTYNHFNLVETRQTKNVNVFLRSKQLFKCLYPILQMFYS
jgi:hypothetical protein